MRIDRSRIRNLDNYLAAVPPGSRFLVIHEVAADRELSRIGLDDPGAGQTILPASLGPISRFNAEGRWQILRDLPKESRYIRTVRWRWTTWDGDEHEDYKDIYRECYQRELVPPPAVELTYMEHEGRRLVVSPSLANESDAGPLNLHTVNLFLELFGSCEIAKEDLERLVPPALKKANWKLLPSGEYPWSRVREHVEHALRRIGEATRSVILDRQKTIEECGPDERWVGEGGFDDYMAYVFKKSDLVILESLRKDNALYVFKGDWRAVSQLTKAEIIQNGLHHARIVHTQGWKDKLARLF